MSTGGGDFDTQSLSTILGANLLAQFRDNRTSQQALSHTPGKDLNESAGNVGSAIKD
jgi:hypothetical protein